MFSFVMPESGGIRKALWRRSGLGKSDGMRGIYSTRNVEDKVVLPTLCTKWDAIMAPVCVTNGH